MSHFYGSIVGSRGEATLGGSPNSGINGHVRGWDVGVRVSGSVQESEDVFHVFATGGSNARQPDTLLGTVSLDADGKLTFIAAVKA